MFIYPQQPRYLLKNTLSHMLEKRIEKNTCIHALRWHPVKCPVWSSSLKLNYILIKRTLPSGKNGKAEVWFESVMFPVVNVICGCWFARRGGWSGAGETGGEGVGSQQPPHRETDRPVSRCGSVKLCTNEINLLYFSLSKLVYCE